MQQENDTAVLAVLGTIIMCLIPVLGQLFGLYLVVTWVTGTENRISTLEDR
jgi:hypothetical protein